MSLHDRFVRNDQELNDERTARVVDSKVWVRRTGKVLAVDPGARKLTAKLDGAEDGSPGIQYGEHEPVVGDDIHVLQGPPGSIRIVERILGREAGYLRTGILTTRLLPATGVQPASVTVDAGLTYPPGWAVYRIEGSANALPYRARAVPGTLANLSGQVIGSFDAWVEVIAKNRTRLTVEATALTAQGLPATDFRYYIYAG